MTYMHNISGANLGIAEGEGAPRMLVMPWCACAHEVYGSQWCDSVRLSVCYWYVCSPGEIQELVYTSTCIMLQLEFARFMRKTSSWSYIWKDLITMKALASNQHSSEGKAAHCGSLHNLTVRLILQQ